MGRGRWQSTSSRGGSSVWFWLEYFENESSWLHEAPSTDQSTVLCVFCMATITVNVGDALKERMEKHLRSTGVKLRDKPSQRKSKHSNSWTNLPTRANSPRATYRRLLTKSTNVDVHALRKNRPKTYRSNGFEILSVVNSSHTLCNPNGRCLRTCDCELHVSQRYN